MSDENKQHIEDESKEKVQVANDKEIDQVSGGSSLPFNPCIPIDINL